jgi:2-polyprenyl-3-methyl-5-hydroxy-6-metoxy-1,4-benzoquinol methylase
LAASAGPGPVLKLGIATGRVALSLADRGIEVHGVDASPAMIAQLRNKLL